LIFFLHGFLIFFPSKVFTQEEADKLFDLWKKEDSAGNLVVTSVHMIVKAVRCY